MSLTCGLCDQQIDPGDTVFHLSEKCQVAKEMAAILNHDIEHDGPISKAIERIVEKALGRQHEWQGLSNSGSGDWKCTKCDLYTNGGLHDGGPYYPGRGQILPPCSGGNRLSHYHEGNARKIP